MKNYKLDIKEMAEQFNNLLNLPCDYIGISDFHDLNEEVSQEQMSEMVQKHAEKLGCQLAEHNNCCIDYVIIRDGMIETFNDNYVACFEVNKLQKIGLEFFSIKPEKFVTVRMPEEDYNYFIVETGFNKKGEPRKWELVE